MPTTTSASTTFFQNGSNSGSANERRRPLKSGTGAGRTRIALAPRSTTHSSSSIALSTIGSVMTGVGKIRFSKLNVHCSCIHWLSAWTTTWVATGSSVRRSSSRLASVGHIIARSMPCSSISMTRASGSKNAGGRLDVLRRRRELELLVGRGHRVGVLELELELLGAGGRDLVERRVRDVVADLVLDRDLGAPVHLDVLDDALVLRREVLRERVGRLVHVVVGVEDEVVELASHRCDSPFASNGAGVNLPPGLTGQL